MTSDEFLPFADASFDLVTCYEAFHYVEDPRQGVDEIRRVLRPGGATIVSVPFVWEYDRTILEHRYGPELGALFEDWEDVNVIENATASWRGNPDGDVARTGTGAYPEARWRRACWRGRGLGPLRGHERCSGRPRPARPQIRRQRSAFLNPAR